MGFSIGSENFESLALGDTPLEALMLGDVELWSASPSVPPLQPITVGSTTQTSLPGWAESGTISTFQVTGGGRGRFKVSINGPATDYHWGNLTRYLTLFHPGGLAVKTWSGPTDPTLPWIVSDDLTNEINVPEDGIFTVVLTIRADEPWDRYLNSWSIELIPSEVEVPVDPTEPVVITGTNWGESQTQFRDALTARGLDYQTVTTIPFPMDTSQATGLQGLFQDCAALTSVPELDTSNVTNMTNMFSGCASLSTVPAMDTSQVTNMSAMYAFNPSLTSVPEMDTSNVTDMSFMFSWCTALAYVPDMTTSTVTNMTSMLSGTQSLTDGNIRLFGQHPSVNKSGMLEFSALTVEPFFSPVSTTVLSVDPSQILEGGLVTLTAVVTPPEEGSITFAVAGQTTTVEVIGGEASATFTVETSGVYTATAEFDPTSEFFLPSSDSELLTVLAPAVETATDLTFSPLEPTEFEEFTLTATVTPSGAVGSILFTIDGQTSTVPVAGGVATETFTIEVAGDYPVTADFIPDDEGDFTTSSDSDIITITELVATQTTTVLSVVPDEIVEGEQVLLTATVTPSSAVGDVTFTLGTQTSTVALAGGTASTTLTLDTPGEYGATAEFVPTDEADFTASSATGSVTVLEFVPDPVETTTTLVVVPEELEEGELVTVTATVTPAEAAGVIEFDVAGQLSTVNVVNGEASTTATLDVAGEHAITADFVPTSELDFLPSSATSSVTVTEPAPAGVTPALIESTGPVTLSQSPTAQTLIVTHTVVGSGHAKVDFTCNVTSPGGSGIFWRRVTVHKNGVKVSELPVIGRVSGTVTGSVDLLDLEDGDVLTLTGYTDSWMDVRYRKLNWWTFSLTPA